MVGWLLNLAYFVVLLICSPWLLYQDVGPRQKYREGWAAKFLGLVPRRLDQRECIWIHAVSVGEVNLLTPLIERLLREYPQYDIVLPPLRLPGWQ